MSHRKWVPQIFVAVMLLSSPIANASETPAATEPHPYMTEAKAAVKKMDYATAIKLLESYVTLDANDAEAWNMLGYSYRKSGNLDKAFANYDRALKINPKHLGAHEYVGEAYLMANNLPKAEEHLAILDKLCVFSCEEFRDLKKAVADFKATGKVAWPAK